MSKQNQMSKFFVYKIFVFVFIFSSAFSPVLSGRVFAQWVVYDPANFAVNSVTSANSVFQTTKEGGLDGLAWIIVNLIVERMTATTVNWINSGFNGKPAYISNPEGYFGDLADNIAGQYIFENPNLNFLCSPISAKIRLALAQNYIQDRQWQCTLTQVGRNMEDFMNDFGNGGWENFFELTQRPQNNPIGAYIQAKGELDIQIANKTLLKQKELDYGSGFLSFKTCKRWGSVVSPGQSSGLGGGTGDYVDPETGVPMNTLPDSPQDPSGAQRVCLEEEISTPGSVIQENLNNVLNIGNDKLAVADEINEIVSALLNQMVSQVVGGIGKGLRGLSSGSSSQKSFADQVLERNANSPITASYFCMDDPSAPGYNPNVCQNPLTPNIDILNQPPPETPEPPSGLVYPPSSGIQTPPFNNTP